MADGSASIFTQTDDTAASYLDRRNQALREAQAEQVMLRRARTSPAVFAQQQSAPAVPQPGNTLPFGRWRRGTGGQSKVLDDITTGIEEAPLQAFAGMSDAIGNALIAADDLAGWLNTHVADLRSSTLFGMAGTDAPDKSSPEVRQFAEGFKALPRPESVTGGVVRASAVWLAGLSASARGLQALGAGAIASTIAGGGISSFFAQAADDPGLANLVQQHPALANPVTDFLATKPGDNAALNRLKHSLEGLGLGALTDGFMRGLLFVQMARAARGSGEGIAETGMIGADAAKPAAGSAQAMEAEAARDLDLERLGDPNAPLIGPASASPAAPEPIPAEPTALGEGDARYVIRAGRKYAALESGSDDLGLITPGISKVTRREAGPIRLPEGEQNAATGTGYGELHIEARHGAEIRAYGYPDAASLTAEVAAGFGKIYDAGGGSLLLVKTNGGSKVAVIELKAIGEGAFAAHWEVQAAGIYRPEYFNGKQLLWERPGPDDPATGGGTPFNPRGQSTPGLTRPSVGINFAKIDDLDDVKAALNAMKTSGTDGDK
mgnify:CR=1 FL=1